MDIYSKFCENLIALLALFSVTLSAPVVKKLEDLPSTYRRVRMAHKFGIVAVNKSGKVYLTRDITDENSILVLHAYGPRKHRIQGEKSGLNIAMNSKGKVYATREATNESLFLHSLLLNYRHVFRSSLYKGYLLGFNKQMRPKKGSRARLWKSDRCYFTILEPKNSGKRKDVNPLFYDHFQSGRQG